MRKLLALLVGLTMSLGIMAALPALAEPTGATGGNPNSWNLYTSGQSGGYHCDMGTPQVEGGTVFVSGPYETRDECLAAIPSPSPSPSESPSPTTEVPPSPTTEPTIPPTTTTVISPPETTTTSATTAPPTTSEVPTSTTTASPSVEPPGTSTTTSSTSEEKGPNERPGKLAFTGVEDVVPLVATMLLTASLGSGLLWLGRKRDDD